MFAPYPALCLSGLHVRTLARACLGLLSATILVPAAVGSSTPVDPRVSSVIAELEKTRTPHQVALSPDGQMIAWTVDADGGIELQVAPTADPSRPHRLTAGNGASCSEENLAWAPDSKTLAFTSDCNAQDSAGGQADVYLAVPSAASSSPRRLTHLHGGVTTLAFSPDGLHIGCLYIEGASRPAGALAAVKPPARGIGGEGLEIQRVAVIEAASGDSRQATPAAPHVYEYDWAPDSRQLTYVAAPPPGENNWWVAQLYTQPLTGGEPRSILAPEHTPGPLHGLQMAVPRWSPDGQQIAFIGGLMSDQGATGGDIYLIPAAGGEAKDVTPNANKTAAWIHWTNPAEGSAQLLVSWVSSGQVEIALIDPASGKTATPGYPAIPASISDGRLEQSLSIDH